MASAISILRVAVAAPLLYMFAGVAYFNAKSVWKNNIRHERFPSVTPTVGGVMGMIGLWLLPVPEIARFACIPLLLDVGCVPYFIGGVLCIVWETRRSRP